MIARLEGLLFEKHADARARSTCGGVGYEVLDPALDLRARCPTRASASRSASTPTLRENALQLFGFATRRSSATAFELLLHASRVGPKLAQTVLSGLDADAICSRAIRDGESRPRCRRCPGVGAKLAQRIVLELRDRARRARRAAVAGAARRRGAARAARRARAAPLRAREPPGAAQPGRAHRRARWRTSTATRRRSRRWCARRCRGWRDERAGRARERARSPAQRRADERGYEERAAPAARSTR